MHAADAVSSPADQNETKTTEAGATTIGADAGTTFGGIAGSVAPPFGKSSCFPFNAISFADVDVTAVKWYSSRLSPAG